jgi:hypothetical protein
LGYDVVWALVCGSRLPITLNLMYYSSKLQVRSDQMLTEMVASDLIQFSEL